MSPILSPELTQASSPSTPDHSRSHSLLHPFRIPTGQPQQLTRQLSPQVMGQSLFCPQHSGRREVVKLAGSTQCTPHAVPRGRLAASLTQVAVSQVGSTQHRWRLSENFRENSHQESTSRAARVHLTTFTVTLHFSIHHQKHESWLRAAEQNTKRTVHCPSGHRVSPNYQKH